jgi:ABC-type dipeptide/oligopeptide/nickel transport system permease subunit
MMRHLLNKIYHSKDLLWTLIWIGGVAVLTVWDAIFLNAPAFYQLQTGFLNTIGIALMVIVISLWLGWFTAITTDFLQRRGNQPFYLAATFVLNIIRSVPQIVGILLGFVLITQAMSQQILTTTGSIITAVSVTISLFVFLEISDLVRERIAHFRRSDFYNAMLVCGIPEWRIINFDILWKNSRAQILNKLIAVFGMSIFLLCSIDFIISVGLTTDINTINFPVTLGSLLAKVDSKQDVLAIGHTLFNPGYFPNLFFKHLQGISVAFLIVFTLICIFKISNGFARRHEL